MKLVIRENLCSAENRFCINACALDCFLGFLWSLRNSWRSYPQCLFTGLPCNWQCRINARLQSISHNFKNTLGSIQNTGAHLLNLFDCLLDLPKYIASLKMCVNSHWTKTAKKHNLACIPEPKKIAFLLPSRAEQVVQSTTFRPIRISDINQENFLPSTKSNMTQM